MAWLILEAFLCISPGILAAAKGRGPWMVIAAITSLISLLNLFRAVMLSWGLTGLVYSLNQVLFPTLILACLGFLFSWAAIREERRATENQN